MYWAIVTLESVEDFTTPDVNWYYSSNRRSRIKSKYISRWKLNQSKACMLRVQRSNGLSQDTSSTLHAYIIDVYFVIYSTWYAVRCYITAFTESEALNTFIVALWEKVSTFTCLEVCAKDLPVEITWNYKRLLKVYLKTIDRFVVPLNHWVRLFENFNALKWLTFLSPYAYGFVYACT